MQINGNYIKSLLEQGENSGVEFKNSDVRSESLAKEIVAFGNSTGGTILLGVDDDKTISGLIDEKSFEEWVMNIARNSINPAINIEYSELDFEGKTLGIINVPKGKDKPYQANDNKFYVRVGSTNRVASINELMRLFQQSGAFHFDITPVDKTAVSSLNFFKLSEYFNTYKINFENLSKDEQITLLKNSDILDENGKVTVAGLMIFGINPQQYMPFARISFAHYKTDKIDSHLLNKKNLEGNLTEQIDSAVKLIINSLSEPSDISGTKRENSISSYPEKVYRELIVNACCHRNYSITGSAIRVFLFTDRLEVISPGKLPNTVTVEKLKAGVSYATNPAIVKFMENMNYIDKLGRGLPMVWQEAQKLQKQVTFEEIGEEFKVTVGI